MCGWAVHATDASFIRMLNNRTQASAATHNAAAGDSGPPVITIESIGYTGFRVVSEFRRGFCGTLLAHASLQHPRGFVFPVMHYSHPVELIDER